MAPILSWPQCVNTHRNEYAKRPPVLLLNNRWPVVTNAVVHIKKYFQETWQTMKIITNSNANTVKPV